jgi:hypothetical protein
MFTDGQLRAELPSIVPIDCIEHITGVGIPRDAGGV